MTDEREHPLDRFFTPEHCLPAWQKSSVSPSGEFSLETNAYTTEPGYSYVSRGIVTRLADGAVVADVKRNYSVFWHAWVKHLNGSEYLLCGEDYQGYTVVDLGNGTKQSYLPPEARKGFGLCWGSVHPAPDGRTLAVEACVWGTPWVLRFYDFTNPTVLPLPDLGGISDFFEEALGWETNDTFAARIEYDIRKSDGARYADLSWDEMMELDRNPDVMQTISEVVRWQRPSA